VHTQAVIDAVIVVIACEGDARHRSTRNARLHQDADSWTPVAARGAAARMRSPALRHSCAARTFRRPLTREAGAVRGRDAAQPLPSRERRPR